MHHVTTHPKHIDRTMSDVRSERKPKAAGFLYATIGDKEQGTNDKRPSTNNREQGVGSRDEHLMSERRHATDIQPAEQMRPISPIHTKTVEEIPVHNELSVSTVPLVEGLNRPGDAHLKTKRSFSRNTFDGIRAHVALPVSGVALSNIAPESEETPVTNVFSADAFREKNIDSSIDGVAQESGENERVFERVDLPQSEDIRALEKTSEEGELSQECAEMDAGENGHGDETLKSEVREEESPEHIPYSSAIVSEGSLDSSDAAPYLLDERLHETISAWQEESPSAVEETKWQDPIVFAPKNPSLAENFASQTQEEFVSLSHIRESDTFIPKPFVPKESNHAVSRSGFFRWHRAVEAVGSFFRDIAQGFRSVLDLFRQSAVSRRAVFVTLSSLLVVAIGTGGFQAARRGIAMKGEVLGVSAEGYAGLEAAIADVKSRDFSSSEAHFADASLSFARASDLLNSWGTLTIEASRFIPVASQLASGSYLADAAKHIADAGQALSRAGSGALLLSLGASENVSFLETFQNIRGSVVEAEHLLSLSQEDLEKVKIEDVPEGKRETFLKLRTELPTALLGMRLLLDHGDIFSDMLGKNGPRRFLFLFQNNHEMRATGGFIGSYAYLDVANGRVRNFFVDGIFNPDGQLKEDIVPPVPIQKISAGWSLHDSNWFPNFPTSAEKAMFFYEKTGGPTVDGVVAITPEVLKRFLEITGPIRLDQYGVTVDSKNFIDLIQYQVEVAYDREENRPKKILSDLAPILLDRLFGSDASTGSVGKTLSAIEDSLSEKHILFYSRNADLESLVSRAGWSGEVLPASRDYLSVINANINGFKTDGVVKESIEHYAEIGDDGTVTDTVVVTRRHTGGQTGREWWDAVNTDYMRVYVPLGSELLSADGYTRETVSPPLDYDALHFSRDADVEREERSVRLDPASGTRISEDAGKTVFGNWVYVSPGEEVRVTYTYRLPFRVDPKRADKAGFDSYSALFQKQAGSFGSSFVSTVSFPSVWHTVWQSDAHLVPLSESGIRFESNLSKDRFVGIVLSNE